MIQSMTGFAVKNATLQSSTGKKSALFLSLKSLNGKFFELNCKLPLAFSHLETIILKRLKNKLKRGHLYLTCFLNNTDIVQGTVEPSLQVVQNYINALNAIKEQHNITQPIMLDHIIRLPNVFNVQEHLTDEQMERDFLTFVDELAEQVIITRIKEGEEITQDITLRLQNIEKYLDLVSQGANEFVERTKEKIQQMLQIETEQTEGADAQKNTLYALLDKIDIHEEISRFQSHLHNMQTQLKTATVEKGKVLDFILQELMRETNTINAKCSDALIAKYAIDLKVEIEKIREQIQNIV
ncbi:YicC family protein [Candidatus Dependentiae bacterium]|nr:MAG: YicC family protein [Candidatus Dependentiae bacterium]